MTGVGRRRLDVAWVDVSSFFSQTRLRFFFLKRGSSFRVNKSTHDIQLMCKRKVNIRNCWLTPVSPKLQPPPSPELSSRKKKHTHTHKHTWRSTAAKRAVEDSLRTRGLAGADAPTPSRLARKVAISLSVRRRGIDVISYTTRQHICSHEYRVDRNLGLYLPQLSVLLSIESNRPRAWFPGPLGPYQAWFTGIHLISEFERVKAPVEYLNSLARYEQAVFWLHVCFPGPPPQKRTLLVASIEYPNSLARYEQAVFCDGACLGCVFCDACASLLRREV